MNALTMMRHKKPPRAFEPGLLVSGPQTELVDRGIDFNASSIVDGGPDTNHCSVRDRSVWIVGHRDIDHLLFFQT